MKLLIFVSLYGSLAAVSGLAAEAVVGAAPTREELLLRRQQAREQEAERKLAPPKGPDPSTATPPRALLKESATICFNGNVTLVPKGSILQLPKNLADRLKYQPGAKLLSWLDFYAINRAWIVTREVSLGQAEGKLAMPEESQKQPLTGGKLVVATFRSGPISVLPPKTPVEGDAKAPSNLKTPTTQKP